MRNSASAVGRIIGTVAAMLFVATVTEAQTMSKPADPCCDVQSIDPDNGSITVQMRTSGTVKWFNVSVADKSLLSAIKVGDPVWDVPPDCVESSGGVPKKTETNSRTGGRLTASTPEACAGTNVERNENTLPKQPPSRSGGKATGEVRTCYVRDTQRRVHALACVLQ
jgi:hypothetical protein